MGKQAAPRKVADNEALAVGTLIRGSAQKLNLVAGLIRGRKAEDALNILQFSKKAMAVDVRKVLASAIAKRSPEEPLAGGELVSSGTLTEASPIAPGETWTASLEGIDLSDLTLTTTA